MEIKFRCGYCGCPTDKNGEPYRPNDGDDFADDCEHTQGECCREGQENEYITVTRDMAIDAQDMSLEGQRWRW